MGGRQQSKRWRSERQAGPLIALNEETKVTPEIHISVDVFRAGVTDENEPDFDEALRKTRQRVQSLIARLGHRYPEFDFVQDFDDE